MDGRLNIRREVLARFLPDGDTIRRFERLFAVVAEIDPDFAATVLRLLQELSIDIGSARAQADSANSAIDELIQNLTDVMHGPLRGSSDTSQIEDVVKALNEYIGALDAKTNSALSLLSAFIESSEGEPGSIRAAINRIAASLTDHQRTVEADEGSLRAALNGLASSLDSLSKSLEVGASRPQFVMPGSFSVDYIDFNQQASFAAQTARLGWDPADDTLDLHHSDGVTQQIGQELYGRILNNTGSTIPNGTCLGINPATNSYVLFLANGTLSPITIVGVTTQAIPNGTNGRITVWGRVRDIDTTGTPFGQVWTAGQILYVSPTIPGGFTNVKPTAPNLSMPIAQVITVSSTTGQIAVRPTIEQQLFYGQFAKTTDQVPTAINTANAITWSSALISNGVSIGAPTSRIVIANAGLYRFSASFQMTSGSASVKNIYLWFRKNGVDIANSTLVTSMDSGTSIRAPSRSLMVSMAAGDYIELMWAADDTNVTLDAIAATAFAPAAPAALLTVQQEQQ